MYGNHLYNEAVKIADEKSKETGKRHLVVPAVDDNNKRIKDMWTVAVPIKETKLSEFMSRLKSK